MMNPTVGTSAPPTKRSRLISPSTVGTLVETIIGCKWSLTVYALLDEGIKRPGEMVRSVEGLTTKVLNSCLQRNVKFGILQKSSYPEIPPRVEYEITEFGRKFVDILNHIRALDQELLQRPELHP